MRNRNTWQNLERQSANIRMQNIFSIQERGNTEREVKILGTLALRTRKHSGTPARRLSLLKETVQRDFYIYEVLFFYINRIPPGPLTNR